MQDQYSTRILSYDLRGNIQILESTGLSGTCEQAGTLQFGTIDNTAYHYYS